MKIWRVEFCQATFSTVLTLIVFTFIAIVPVIMKIWLRKIINVKSSNLLNSIRFIFFISDLDVLSIILAAVALTTFKHLTFNHQDQENIWLIKHK